MDHFLLGSRHLVLCCFVEIKLLCLSLRHIYLLGDNGGIYEIRTQEGNKFPGMVLYSMFLVVIFY